MEEEPGCTGDDRSRGIKECIEWGEDRSRMPYA